MPEDVQPVDRPVDPSVDLALLEQAIRASWDRWTSDTPERFDAANLERDQCGATSLVVHDYLGGELLEFVVFTAGIPTDHHYWNRLPSGQEVDLTRTQFRAGETFGPASSLVRPTLLGPDSQARYERLRRRVAEALDSAEARPLAEREG